MIPFIEETEKELEAFLTVMSLSSICCSLLAGIILTRCRKISISIKLVVFNLALLDILKGLFLIIYMHSNSSVHCYLQDHILYIIHLSSVIQVAFLGPERAVHIYHPLLHQRYVGKKSLLTMCLCIWGLVLGLSAFGCIVKENCYTTIENVRFQIAIPFSFILVSSLLISTISGFLLLYKVWVFKHRPTGSIVHAKSYKGYLIIAYLQICMLILTAPCAVCLIFMSLDKNLRMTMEFPMNDAIRLTSACFTLSGILIPPIYVFRLTECQIRFLQTFCSWHPKIRQMATIMDIQFRMNIVGIPTRERTQIRRRSFSSLKGKVNTGGTSSSREDVGSYRESSF